MSGQSTSQALGCRISLTSNSEIRYEGFLFAINEQENTVSLMNVRMFGTEGRRESPSEEVPAGECLYEHLVFSGSDIKNLTVYEETPLPKDPAILSGKAASTVAAPSDPIHVGTSSSQQHKKPTNYESRRHVAATDVAGARPPTAQHSSHAYHGRGNGGGHSNRSRRRHDEGYGSYQGYNAHQYYETPSRTVYSANTRGNAPSSRGGRGSYDIRANGDSRGGYYDHRHRTAHNNTGQYHHHHHHHNGNPSTEANIGNDMMGNGNRRGGYRRRRGGNQGGAVNSAPHRRRSDRAHTGQDFVVAQDATAARAEFEGDFDFECNNKKLATESKDSLGSARPEKTDENTQVRKGYDKTSSFFDSISCETRDKRMGAGALGGDGRAVRGEDREVAHKVDLETFGTELVQSQRRDSGHNGVRRGYVRRR